MARFFVYAVLLWIAYFLVKKIGKSLFAPTTQREERSPAPQGETEMIRDPQCGSYFMMQKGVKGVVNGKVMHFCSEECYDKYLKEHKR